MLKNNPRVFHFLSIFHPLWNKSDFEIIDLGLTVWIFVI